MHYEYHLLKEHMYILPCTMLTVLSDNHVRLEIHVNQKYREVVKINGTCLANLDWFSRHFMSHDDKGGPDRGLDYLHQGPSLAVGMSPIDGHVLQGQRIP